MLFEIADQPRDGGWRQVERSRCKREPAFVDNA
jgi:hypothetical protein